MINAAPTTISILDREYPLKYSVLAAEALQERFGSEEAAIHGLSSDDGMQKLHVLAALVSILATYGAREWNYAHPAEQQLPDVEENGVLMLFGPGQLSDLIPKVVAAINEGMGREVLSMEDDSSKNSAGA